MSEDEAKPELKLPEININQKRDTFWWFLLACVVLFWGDPDLHDALIGFIQRM